jgi:hypothetical protein
MAATAPGWTVSALKVMVRDPQPRLLAPAQFPGHPQYHRGLNLLSAGIIAMHHHSRPPEGVLIKEATPFCLLAI